MKKIESILCLLIGIVVLMTLFGTHSAALGISRTFLFATVVLFYIGTSLKILVSIFETSSDNENKPIIEKICESLVCFLLAIICLSVLFRIQKWPFITSGLPVLIIFGLLLVLKIPILFRLKDKKSIVMQFFFPLFWICISIIVIYNTEPCVMLMSNVVQP
ncbi:hypothetical protein K5X82_02470 [Halosquirtibacter xylanolyticus]|uniref:hypothetical protein n=1 Tax=Halosquirtibacter xylanolyticus TaxID=3374599 RepID=UPI003749BC8B|nr:hypothetical protein K5X82_02470 [Prolixibacteraceae bacterium]